MTSTASDRGTTEGSPAYVEGTLAVGPGISMYVGEGFSLHARRAGTPFLAVAVDGTFSWADPVGEARMAEGRVACLLSGRACRLEARARRVAILYVNGHSSPGRVLASLAAPGRFPGVVAAVDAVPLSEERPQTMRHAAMAWLRAVGAGELEALQEPTVLADLRSYEEELRRGGPGFATRTHAVREPCSTGWASAGPRRRGGSTWAVCSECKRRTPAQKRPPSPARRCASREGYSRGTGGSARCGRGASSRS